MTFKQKLEHRQKQVFSQSLQQSIKVLELPLLELKGLIETEIAENPALEEMSPDAPAKTENTAEDQSYDQPSSDASSYEETSENPIPGKKENLADFLLKQLRINADDETIIHAGTVIIQHIDENGYLRTGLNELAIETSTAIADLQKALS
ncbi:MAG TPA: hypothetical protein PLU24_05750, partial [Candidatus Omnitrophota bacterium]|nr:hypothetical protein [Candidatus Omnitrophota bacterium]